MKKLLYTLFIGPVCILSMLSIAYLFSREEPLFFLQNIKVNGLSQLGDKETMAKIAPYLTESIFKVDVAKVRDTLTSHPFVKEVSVKRVYPFSIVIDVKEKTPSALWVAADGTVQVLDEKG
jgi:cell division protein FtsQ